MCTVKALLAGAAGMTIGMSMAAVAAPAAPSPVRIQSGWIQGTTEKGLAVYRGIPFAAPPGRDTTTIRRS